MENASRAGMRHIRILIATGNPGKRRELQQLLESAPVTLVLPSEVGLDLLDVPETGDTLGENASLKARAYAQASGLYAIADDTGLFVDALDGRPGIYAARYGGPDDAARRQKLLNELRDVPLDQRTARFECVIALANPATIDCVLAHGICPGKIALHDQGSSGFGYDALFMPDADGQHRTFAQLADEDELLKNVLSHRGDAARKIQPALLALSGDED